MEHQGTNSGDTLYKFIQYTIQYTHTYLYIYTYINIYIYNSDKEYANQMISKDTTPKSNEN